MQLVNRSKTYYYYSFPGYHIKLDTEIGRSIQPSNKICMGHFSWSMLRRDQKNMIDLIVRYIELIVIVGQFTEYLEWVNSQ